MRYNREYIKNNVRWIKDFMNRKGISYKFDWEIYADILGEYLEPNVNWLDLGCGENLWVNEYEKVKFKLGIDILVPTTLKGRSNFCLGDLYKLPFKDNSFDLVTCRFVIEHLERPQQLLGEVHRVLNVEGILIIHTTNIRSVTIIIKDLLPKPIRIYLIRYLTGAPEKKFLPLFYRFNTPLLFQKGIPGFKTLHIVYTQNVFITMKPLMYLSCLYYLLTKNSKLHRFYPIITGVFQKL